MKVSMIELIGKAWAAKHTARVAKAAADEFTAALLNVAVHDGIPIRQGVRLGGIYPRATLTQFHSTPGVFLLDDAVRNLPGQTSPPITHVARRDDVWLLFDASHPTGPVKVHLVYERLRLGGSPGVNDLMAAANLTAFAQTPLPAQPQSRTHAPAFLQGNGSDEDDD